MNVGVAAAGKSMAIHICVLITDDATILVSAPDVRSTTLLSGRLEKREAIQSRSKGLCETCSL